MSSHPVGVKPRVLIIAEMANPLWVSVPLVGWLLSRALAKVTDAHVVTQSRNLEGFLGAGLVEGRDFTAIDSEKVAGPLSRFAQKIRGEEIRGEENNGWTTIMAGNLLGYYYFEHLVWKRFGKRIQAGEFDIVHRITPLSPTLPSHTLARKCKAAGVPFLWGPINGGLPWPKGFDSVRRQEKEWLSYLRGVYKIFPGYRSTRKCASAILIGSQNTFQQMNTRYHEKCFYLPENAIDPEQFSLRRVGPASSPVRAIFVGRLVPLKGVDMFLLAAADLVRKGKLTLEIVGDGPQKESLENIVREENITNGVSFTGWLEHAEVPERLAKADLLALPSIHEFGGGVVLEAMATGLVPLVINHGGPKELVTPKTGFTIPLGTREEITAEIRKELQRIVDCPSMLDTMSEAAYQRAHTQFTWDAKAQQIMRLYDWLLKENGDPACKPSFPMPIPDSDTIDSVPDQPEAS